MFCFVGTNKKNQEQHREDEEQEPTEIQATPLCNAPNMHVRDKPDQINWIQLMSLELKSNDILTIIRWAFLYRRVFVFFNVWQVVSQNE